jgi:retron-type reverse transcriptase
MPRTSYTSLWCLEAARALDVVEHHRRIAKDRHSSSARYQRKNLDRHQRAADKSVFGLLGARS